jgi:hypothetical protein
VEPTKSQNITVNWRRSPSATLGTAARGAPAKACAADCSLGPKPAGGSLSEVPHSRQNLVKGRFSNPHCGQRFSTEVPHSPQNFVPSGFSEPQLGQCMLPLYSFGRSGARKTPEPVSRDRTGGRGVVARYEAHRRKRRPKPAVVGVRPTLEMRLTSTALGRFARWGSSWVSMLKRSEGALYPVGSVRVRPHSSYSCSTEGNQAHPPSPA